MVKVLLQKLKLKENSIWLSLSATLHSNAKKFVFLLLRTFQHSLWVWVCMRAAQPLQGHTHALQMKIIKSNKFYRNMQWIFWPLRSLERTAGNSIEIVKIQYLPYGRFDYLGRGGWLPILPFMYSFGIWWTVLSHE